MALNTKEVWKPIPSIKSNGIKRYAVSSKGRLATYEKDIKALYILKTHLNSGLPMVTVHLGKSSKALFCHKAVALTFLKKPSAKHNRVIHLDYDKTNNHVSNLKWVTLAQYYEHFKQNPNVIKANARKIYKGESARKLNEKKVIQLKKEIWNPKRKLTLKKLADKYQIAEMNLYRIKKGELWFHIHVEGEPIHPKYKKQLQNIEYHQRLEKKQQAKPSKKTISTTTAKRKKK